jgi:L-2-hydroxyglutarate oxidase LhgO
MSAFDVETVVLGAGAVGLACAAHCAEAGHDVVVLETQSHIGSGISSRNSEVIHAGIYYDHGNLKHLCCVEGRRKLYPFLERHGVDHKKCGKLIVATNDDEEAHLSRIWDKAKANGVEGIQWLTGSQAVDLEPGLECQSALLSTETGIFDSHGYMLALQSILENHGGSIAFNAPVDRIRVLDGGGFSVRTGGADAYEFNCRNVINSAGLHAQAIAHKIHGLGAKFIPPLYLAKGSYFSCNAKVPFERLIYPAPVNGGLGVHLTLDMQGRGKFGPDAEWLETQNPDEIDYRVEQNRSDLFYSAIRKYWPGLPDDSITADYSGCRPKVVPSGHPAGDFRLDGSRHHGIDGLVNLFGIESPGLTSSLAIAERVGAALQR